MTGFLCSWYEDFMRKLLSLNKNSPSARQSDKRYSSERCWEITMFLKLTRLFKREKLRGKLKKVKKKVQRTKLIYIVCLNCHNTIYQSEFRSHRDMKFATLLSAISVYANFRTFSFVHSYSNWISYVWTFTEKKINSDKFFS